MDNIYIGGIIGLICLVVMYLQILGIATNTRKTHELLKNFYLLQLKLNKGSLTEKELNYFKPIDGNKLEKERTDKILS